MDDVSLLPQTVWDQAVFAALYFVLVVFLYTSGLKARKEDQEYRREDQQFQAQQQKDWQEFISDMEDHWRAMYKEQRDCDNASMSSVEASLKNLTTVNQAMVTDVKELRSDTDSFYKMLVSHDEQARKILELVKYPEAAGTKHKELDLTKTDKTT